MSIRGWQWKVRLCVACKRLCFIGPCQAQQRRRSRAQIQHEGGSRVFYPDHAGSACIPSVPYAPLLRKQVIRKPVVRASPPPPIRATWARSPPPPPLQVHTPPLAKMPVETRLGGNHTSASDSRSGAIDWARGGCGDHFGLSARLYEVRQLSWRPAQVNSRHFFKALL